MTFFRNIDHSQTYNKCNVACFTEISDKKKYANNNSKQKTMNKFLPALSYFHQILNGIVQKIKCE